jgi:hypothetical protein
MTSTGANVASMGVQSSAEAFEQLRMQIWSLSSYSNSRIVHIAKTFIDLSKESTSVASGCHKAYLDYLERSYAGGEARRCLALLYVCNEILTLDPTDERWQSVLADAMSKYVPLICELALRQQVRCISCLGGLMAAVELPGAAQHSRQKV